MSEQEEFLKDLDQKKDDLLDKPLFPEETDTTNPEPEEKSRIRKVVIDGEDVILNDRQTRRMAKKYQDEREANIALNARLQALSEAKKLSDESGEDPLASVETIFGTDTPEKKAATDILKKALLGMSEQAQQKALEKFEERRNEESNEEEKAVDELNDILEDVEDKYGIDMSNEAELEGFKTLLGKMSPKDKQGNIIEFADPDTAAEVYLSRKNSSTSNRAKELASRSMTRGGSGQSSLKDDAVSRFIRDQGWE